MKFYQAQATACCYNQNMTQQQFIDYLTNIYRKSNGATLTQNTIRRYSTDSISKVQEALQSHLDFTDSLYNIDDLDTLLSLRDQLYNIPEFQKLNKQHDRMYSAGFNRYIEYAEGILFRGMEDKLPLLDRPILFHDAPIILKDGVKEKTYRVYNRKNIIKTQVEQACNYTCQLDPSHKTFIVANTNHQYMEGHHIIPLNKQANFEYSLDCHANVIALCPTCHRMLHYGTYKTKEEKLKEIYDDRGQRLENSGIILDRATFLELANDRPKETVIYTF